MGLRSLATFCVLSAASFAVPAQQTQIRGAVTGHDGKPMRAALVVLSTPGTPSVKQFADERGAFTFPLVGPGAYTLILAGVHHKTLFFPVFIEKPASVQVDVRLAASQYRAEITNLRLIGEFNGFSTDSGGIVMERLPDGTFAATVDWKGDTLSYQILGLLDEADAPICGTDADSFAQDRQRPFIDNADNQFVSVKNTKGQAARIVFDPGKLPRSTSEPRIHFADPTPVAAAFAAIDHDFKVEARRYTAAMNAHVAAGHERSTLTYDRSAQMTRIARQIEEAREPLVKQYLMLRYFGLPEAKANVDLAKRVFREVPPESPVWASLWGGPENTFLRIASVAQADAEEARYVASAIETNPDRTVRAAFLYTALMKAFASKDANAVGRHYTRLMGDFGDTPYAKRAVTMAPSRNIQNGKPVPDFTFTSLDDGGIVTANSLLGKTYLLDFWAVWCGPCVAEMGVLHTAYEKFKDKGLVIVSVSFDEKPKQVEEFRKAKWPMPWFNSLLPGFDHETARAFEVIGIPKPVLVGPDGKILATGGELRGNALLETLARVFGTGVQR